MDLDAYMVKLNLWREEIENRLAALEQNSHSTPASAPVSTDNAQAIEALRNELRAAFVVVDTRLATVEERTNDIAGVLPNVESVLAEHSNTLMAMNTPATPPPPQPVNG